MGTIQGGIAKVAGSDNNLAIAVQDVQTMVIQAREQDVFMAYSEGGLSEEVVRYRIARTRNDEGMAEGLILTFPHSPYSGTLYFQSASGLDPATVIVWSVKCGHRRMQGGY